MINFIQEKDIKNCVSSLLDFLQILKNLSTRLHLDKKESIKIPVC